METSKTDYLLLIRGLNWQQGLSPEEIEQALNRFMGWVDGMTARGVLKGANPLMNEGKVVTGPGGRSVVDGPFAEAKEAVGGYFLLHVASEAEAVALAQQCPALAHGAIVEVRQVAPECPMITALHQKAAASELELATA